MVDNTGSTTLEIVSLPNGRFTVQAVGDTVAEGETGDYATFAEAEDAMFGRNQDLELRSDTLDVLKPGGGQGLP